MNITRQEIEPMGRVIKFEDTPYAVQFEHLPLSLNAQENGFPMTLRLTVFQQWQDGTHSIRAIFEQDCHSAEWLWNMVYSDVRAGLRSECYIHNCTADESRAIEQETAAIVLDLIPEEEWDPGQRNACPGHEWSCSGTAYGGDDERWCGEGRMTCIHCGADGDA